MCRGAECVAACCVPRRLLLRLCLQPAGLTCGGQGAICAGTGCTLRRTLTGHHTASASPNWCVSQQLASQGGCCVRAGLTVVGQGAAACAGYRVYAPIVTPHHTACPPHSMHLPCLMNKVHLHAMVVSVLWHIVARVAYNGVWLSLQPARAMFISHKLQRRGRTSAASYGTLRTLIARQCYSANLWPSCRGLVEALLTLGGVRVHPDKP